MRIKFHLTLEKLEKNKKIKSNNNTTLTQHNMEDSEDLISGIQILEHVQLLQRRKGDKSIRILQLTDMHLFPPHQTTWKLGANKQHRVVDFVKDGYDPGNKKAILLVQTLLQNVQPDLVIFTGDIVDGRPHTKDDSWQTTFKDIIQPLLETTPITPWTFCPGNHDDDDAPWTRNDLLEIFQLPGCISPKCQSFNHTYTLGIHSKEDSISQNDPTTSTRLWIFDSGGNHPTTRYDPFPKNIVNGYKQLTQAIIDLPDDLKEKFKVAADLAFFHIPLPEYSGIDPIVGENNLFNAILSSNSVPSPWKFCPWLVRCLGKDKIAGSSTINSGMFEALRKGKLLATFVGHDHYSDYVGSRGTAPYMTYGRVTSYAPPSNFEGNGGKLPWKPGGRVVRIEKNTAVATWIETIDGPEEKSRIMLDGSHHEMVWVKSRRRQTFIVVLIMVLMILSLYWLK